MIVKLQTEHHLEFLSLKGGCRGSSESTFLKMSNCWKPHAAAHYKNKFVRNEGRCHIFCRSDFVIGALRVKLNLFSELYC